MPTQVNWGSQLLSIRSLMPNRSTGLPVQPQASPATGRRRGRYRGASSEQSRRRWVARRRRRTIPTIVTPDLANEEAQVSHIPTIISKRPPLDSHCQPPRYTTGAHRPLLPQVQRDDALPTINRGSATSDGFATAPTLYVINPTSLAKPHALQNLHADLIANNIEIAIVSESWFKTSHTNQAVSIPGYHLFRRDRPKRRGGGVAIYVTDKVNCSIHTPTVLDDQLESLWIKTRIENRTCYIGALYHPPPSASRAYTDDDQIGNIQSTIEEIDNNGQDCVIILAGDFNQLKDDDLTQLGLINVVDEPTHHGHKLDRIYTTCDIYSSHRVVKSNVTTAHQAIIARADVGFIVDLNKTSNKIEFRKQTPAKHAAFLQYLQSVNWTDICTMLCICTICAGCF